MIGKTKAKYLLGKTNIHPREAKEAEMDNKYPSSETNLHIGLRGCKVILKSTFEVEDLKSEFFALRQMRIFKHRYKRQHPRSQKASIPSKVFFKWG